MFDFITTINPLTDNKTNITSQSTRIALINPAPFRSAVRTLPTQKSIFAVNQKNSTNIAETTDISTEKKKMVWGEPVWFFFHTMTEKMIPENFAEIKVGFLNVIYMICTNLPCPTCAKHAKEHLDSTNFNAINTKEQLKIFIFDFHNIINKQKGFQIMTLEELNAKYVLANTRLIIYNFMQTFAKSNKNIHLIADDLHRQHIVAHIKIWLNNNIINFLP
jgi:hypothetical protein